MLPEGKAVSTQRDSPELRTAVLTASPLLRGRVHPWRRTGTHGVTNNRGPSGAIVTRTCGRPSLTLCPLSLYLILVPLSRHLFLTPYSLISLFAALIPSSVYRYYLTPSNLPPAFVTVQYEISLVFPASISIMYPRWRKE